MSDTPNMDRVQKEFLAAIAKNGMRHTFDWMASWFDRVAGALVDDELLRCVGPKPPEGMDVETLQALVAADNLMSLARGISNHSSSASANLMREALCSAWAYRLDGGSGPGSRVQRNKAWEAWRALNEPKAEASKTPT